MKIVLLFLLVAAATAKKCCVTLSGCTSLGLKDGEICADVDDCDTCKSPGTVTGDCKAEVDCTCFPGSAIVTLDNGNTKTMAELNVGDKVLTANGVFSEVYMFSHRFTDASASFVQIDAGGATLELTGGHYMYANGDLKQAQYVKVGDNVTLASGKAAKVTAVDTVTKKGIYNPHTLQGDIVVNGVLTSTYTAAFSPTLAHLVLAPLRSLYQMGVDIFKLDIGSSLDHLPVWWKTMYQA